MKSLTPTPVRSPCVKVCEMDEAVGLCKGCCRTDLAPSMGQVESKQKD